MRGGGSTHHTNGNLFGKWPKRLYCSPCPSASRVAQTQTSPKTLSGPGVRYQRHICFLGCPFYPLSSKNSTWAWPALCPYPSEWEGTEELCDTLTLWLQSRQP